MIIGSKAEIRKILYSVLEKYSSGSMDAFVSGLHLKILKQKVRFPLLEFCAVEISKVISEEEQISFSDKIIALKERGSYVLAGIILQLRLNKDIAESFRKASEYIITGNEWYVCDIIGERVMGYALLHFPEQTLPLLQAQAKHSNTWMVRAVGVASHYATKKGLKKAYVAQMFEMLLSLSGTTDFHTRKGIGWAVKTTAKFYPDLIAVYKPQLENPEVKQWFTAKIKIGLGRSEKYASRYPG